MLSYRRPGRTLSRRTQCGRVLVDAGARSQRGATPTDAELAEGVSRKLLADPAYVRVANILPDMECFDAAFFCFSPREMKAGLERQADC